MKKILRKDKKVRDEFNGLELKRFYLKLLLYNENFFKLIRWKNFIKLNKLCKKGSITKNSNRCIQTINRKRFNKLTNLSRTVFLKKIRLGYVSNIKKASW